MGVHTARYARAVSMYNQARYGGNNATLTDWAFRAWNWASYMVLDDGLAVVGPAASNNLWCVWLMLSHLVRCHVCKFCLFSRFRIQAAAVMDMMHAMRYIHYWQPVADHLLEFTCAPTAVSFTSKNISYNVSCGAAVETLKVTFDPASVKHTRERRLLRIRRCKWTSDYFTRVTRRHQDYGLAWSPVLSCNLNVRFVTPLRGVTKRRLSYILGFVLK
jgi:hypothetical protein